MAGRTNSITTHPQRGLVDAALVTGQTPNSIAEQYADTLQPPVSRSAIYRYARSKRSPLTPQWISDDLTVTEAASDLGAVLRDLRRRYDAALSNTDARGLSREIANVASVLKQRFDAETDDDLDALRHADEIARLLSTVCRDVPGALTFARSRRMSPELAADLEGLAEAIEQYKKENHA
jgi:hypothetical protein